VSRTVRLLGRPQVTLDGEVVAAARGNKPWALLAYLVCTRAPLPRRLACDLLFADAEDPLAALRWNLSALRQVLASPDVLRGDPLVLDLAGDTLVDVVELQEGRLPAVESPGSLGLDLLEPMHFPSAPRFEVWLENERRHLRGLLEGLAHESAQAHLAVGRADRAAELATLLVQLEPLDEGHQALLVRALAAGGHGVAAARQVAECRQLFRRELGVEPGARLDAAARVVTSQPVAAARSGRAAVVADIEAGTASVDAGVVDAGVQCLRRAVVEAADIRDAELEARALTALGSALVHGVRGLDDEGATALHRALAVGGGHGAVAATAARELGYVEFLRGRYERVGPWLERATAATGADPAELARIASVRGSALTDTGQYAAALAALDEAVAGASDERARSYAESMRGRVHLMRGALDRAAEALTTASELSLRDGWTAFAPWPDSLLAEVDLARGEVDEAARRVGVAFEQSCRLGDPCWEGLSGRGRALVLAAQGDHAAALHALQDAWTRSTRLPDGYVWVDALVLETTCRVAFQLDAVIARQAADRLVELAGRCGMSELLVRGLQHQARLGRPESGVLALELDAGLEVSVVDSLGP
jgi:DNA-binding SARP family transcriptional activator